ncbi:Uncharacterised protein [Klebsiella michiganensis]|nr:Uncharacterised protein [Klebsiella michiganensis]
MGHVSLRRALYMPAMVTLYKTEWAGSSGNDWRRTEKMQS